MSRYGICEWYGSPLSALTPVQRRERAAAAWGNASPLPCPFRADQPPCRKAGGVCSLQVYPEGTDGRVGIPVTSPVTVCPERFEQDHTVIRWLAEIVGFPPEETMVAREVPFMQNSVTGKPACKIDLVIGRDARAAELHWYGVERQAVYFSGPGMDSQFHILLENEGDIIWLIPEFVLDADTNQYRMQRGHWEVLTLEASTDKLLAAQTVSRSAFEEALARKLARL